MLPELLNITANNASTGNLKEYKVFNGRDSETFAFKYYDENGEKKVLAKDSGSITTQLSLENVYLINNSITGIYSQKKKIIEG